MHAAALDVLQHIEVIGGDLLLKRAHQLGVDYSGHRAGNGRPDQSQTTGSAQLVTMSGDLASRRITRTISTTAKPSTR